MDPVKKFWNVSRSATGRYLIDLFGYVGGSKDGWLVEGFNENEFLDEFRQIPVDAPIDLTINSTGGLVYTALSIYSILSAHPAPITIRVNGVAMSAATIITSLPNAHVVMPLGSIMMIHRVSSGAVGNADEIKKEAEITQKIEDQLIDIYAKKTGRDEKEVRKAVEAETWLTAQEAVEFGLADEVDEAVTVTNSREGGVTMVNGLEIPQGMLAKVPSRFFAAAPKVPAAIQSKEDPMDLEKLKAEHPDLVQQIRQEAMEEGRKAERERINALEDLAMPGFANLLSEAKADSSITPEAFAVKIVKAQKALQKKSADDAADDAKGLETVLQDGNQGLQEQQEVENEAEMAAVIEAGKRGFRNRK